MTTTAATKRIRKHLAASRAMQRNLRLRLYQGRNGGGEGYAYHEAKAEELMAELPRQLQGELRMEHSLALRISEARDSGQQRPELRARLAAHRRTIKALA
jgi:hypothetical protein